MIFNERKEQVKSYLGKTVAVKIDRPLGSAHPKYSNMIYPVNYGYIPGVIGGDGEALDVYVLAVGQPLTEFTGRVIGIVHRENDIEDKLVAAPDGVKFNQAEIAEAVYFQEQYYQIIIESIYHKSCGVVIYRKNNGKTEYLLLLQKKSQTWSFPKGHMEAGETEEQTALREVLEEVGIKATLLSGFREDVTYSISDSMEKTVVLFLSAVTSDPIIRESEIVESQWLDSDQAKTLLYPEYYEILYKVESYFKNRPI